MPGGEHSKWGREKRIPPVKDPLFQRIDVQVVGERNLPQGAGRIPVDLLPDFEAAWRAFQERYPAYTLEAFLRYVFKKGTVVAVRRVHFRTIPPPR